MPDPAVVAAALRRNRDVHALRGLLVYFGTTALAATAIAVIAAVYLLGLSLHDIGFVLLAGALILMSFPAAAFLVDHYRR